MSDYTGFGGFGDQENLILFMEWASNNKAVYCSDRDELLQSMHTDKLVEDVHYTQRVKINNLDPLRKRGPSRRFINGHRFAQPTNLEDRLRSDIASCDARINESLKCILNSGVGGGNRCK